MKIKILVLILTVIFLIVNCEKETKVPPQKKEQASLKKEGSSFDKDGYRYVFNKEHKYLEFFGPDNKKIANIYFYDNGPDYYSEGLRRIVDNGKIGFINQKNQIIIAPQYDFAQPFKNGYSIIAKDVQYVKDGEHTYVKSSQWGLIDKKGELILPMKYKSIGKIENGKVKVSLEGKEKVIKIK